MIDLRLSAVLLLIAFSGSLGCASSEDDGGGSDSSSGGNFGAAGSASGGAPSGGGSGGDSSGGASVGGAGSGGSEMGSGGSSAGSGGDGAGGQGTGGDGAGGGSTSVDCNTSAVGPVITVAKEGAADFRTVQAAVQSVSKSNATPTIVRIAPGTYVEKLLVDRPNVTLCGRAGQTRNTILSFGDGADTPNGSGGTLGTSGSYSVQVSANRVSIENLTIQNTRGVGSQAVALLLSGSEIQVRDSRLLGHQDTLYTRSGSQYFRDTYIEGTVDFIFGAATAVFEDCTLHSVGGGTALTAPSTEQTTPFGLVFLGGRVTADASVRAGTVALGRNWRPYGAATYVRTELGAHVSGVGWVKMSENTLATARFAEFETSGPGAKPTERARESRQLSASEAALITVERVLAPWVPTYSEEPSR